MSHVTCARPPAGWRCTRDAGHHGPCAAVHIGTEHELALAAGEQAMLVQALTNLKALDGEMLQHGEASAEKVVCWRSTVASAIADLQAAGVTAGDQS